MAFVQLYKLSKTHQIVPESWVILWYINYIAIKLLFLKAMKPPCAISQASEASRVAFGQYQETLEHMCGGSSHSPTDSPAQTCSFPHTGIYRAKLSPWALGSTQA